MRALCAVATAAVPGCSSPARRAVTIGWVIGLLLAVLVAAPATAAPGLERFYIHGAAFPEDPVQGPDGAVWFDVHAGLGRIAADGTVAVHSTPGMDPFRPTVGPDGALWFIDPNHNSVGRMDLLGAVTRLPTSLGHGAELVDIAAGADGNLWLTDRGNHEAIWRVTPAGQATQLRLPADTLPAEITAGPDGNLWFTTGAGVGRVTPGGVIRLFELPTTGGQGSIASGPDGNLWVSDDIVGGHLVRVRPDGTSTFVRVPGRVHDVSTGPDGNIWFTVQGSGFDFRVRGSGVGRMAPDGTHLATWREPFGGNFVDGGFAFDADSVLWGCLRGGQSLVRLAPGPTSPSPLEPFLGRNGALRGARTLAAGTDGTMWIAGHGGIVRVNAAGVRTVFRRGVARSARSLLPVADGAVWFAYGGRGIARLSPSGSVRRYDRGFSRRARPEELALGPDRAVWFIDAARNAVGRMSSAGRVREFVRGLGRHRALLTIAAGPDRRMWVTDQSGSIDAISMNGRAQRFTRGLGRHAQPTAIASGPDGNLWFTQYFRRRVGRITTAGRVTLWTTRGPPASIAAGPDGALWFTTTSTAREANFLDVLGSYAGVGRIATSGALREFPVRPVESTGYKALAAGPDKKIWFLEDQGPIALARLDPQRLAELGESLP